MTPAQTAAVNRVVGRFLRAGAPADRDDLCQEAYLVCLEVAPRVRSEATASAYYQTAIRRALARMVSRDLSVVTLSDHQLINARHFAIRESEQEVGHDQTPEHFYACGQVRSEVARLLAERLNGRAQRALDAEFGADRLEVLRGRPAFLAFARGSVALAELWELLGGGGH